MRKLKFILFIFVLYTTIVHSQKKYSGTVEYIVKNRDNFDIRTILNKKDLKNMSNSSQKKMLSSMMKTGHFMLIFNGKESMYKKKELINQMQIDFKNKMNISFLSLFGGGDNKYYTNIEKKEVLVQEKSIILEKKYLIKYNFSDWKVTKITKKIGHYICYKAITRTNNKYITTVWFTPELPAGFGPKLYNGLPGLVLEVNKGEIVFKATKIILNPIKTIMIKKPIKGIKLTAKEYKEKIKKAVKEKGFEFNKR